MFTPAAEEGGRLDLGPGLRCPPRDRPRDVAPVEGALVVKRLGRRPIKRTRV